MYRFVYLAPEKDKLKNLPKTVVFSLNNEGRVIFKLKLIYLNESKQKWRPNTSSFVPIACDLQYEYSKENGRTP